jgi:hypothetical protein
MVPLEGLGTAWENCSPNNDVLSCGGESFDLA